MLQFLHCTVILFNIVLLLQIPQTEEEWLCIADGYQTKANFPNCIGALDGKHVAILPPPNSGSTYFNYKHHFSLILLALVDVNCRFIYVDVGAHGRMSDGGVYNNSSLSQALENNTLNIPGLRNLPGTSDACPHVIVADDAFALKTYLLKPYALRNLIPDQRTFNYRLSRARRTVENAFGQLSQRFRVFGRPIPLTPDKVKTLVMASCCLHNFLLRDDQSRGVYMPADELNNVDMSSIPRQGGNRSSAEAQTVRNKFCDYFNSPHGELQGQLERSLELNTRV